MGQPFSVKLTDYAGQWDVLKQVAFDVFIHPIWFFPMYYTLKEALCGQPNIFEADSVAKVGAAALSKYYKNNFDRNSEEGLLADWLAFWKIWIIGDVVVYGCCPMWAR